VALFVVEGEDRWFDLFLDVVPKTDLCQVEYTVPTTAENWCDADGFSVTLQKAVTQLVIERPAKIEFREIVLLTDPGEKREAARRIFEDYNPQIAERMSRSNAAIFLNRNLITSRAQSNDSYLAKVITHEAVGIVEETSGLVLVRGHNPSVPFDDATEDTFAGFRDAVGDAELKRRYPTLF
jgi:hypothetical protein